MRAIDGSALNKSSIGADAGETNRMFILAYVLASRGRYAQKSTAGRSSGSRPKSSRKPPSTIKDRCSMLGIIFLSPSKVRASLHSPA